MTDPTVINMVKTMFDGFKIGIDLEVVGSIVKTNAEYVNGSRLTLLEWTWRSSSRTRRS